MLWEWRGALTGFAVVGVLLLLSASIEPAIPGFAALEMLRFHFAAALLVLLALLALSGGWRRAILLAVPVIASLVEGGLTIAGQQGGRNLLAGRPSAPALTLMSFNLLFTNPNGPALADMIIASGADVVVTQETKAILPEFGRLAQASPYRIGCDGELGCDLALFSKTPFEHAQIDTLSDIWPDRYIEVTTTIRGNRINVVGVHLIKPYYDLFARDEARNLAWHLSRLEGPVVVAGDFNTAPWSGTIARLMRDASLLPGPSYPATAPVELGPLGIPIDNVLSRPPLIIEGLTAFDDPMGSNHRGLIARLGLVAY